MKKLILLLLLAIGVVFSGKAQKMPTADEMAKKNVDEMEKRLSLTATQKGIIYNYAYTFAKEQLAFYKKQMAGTLKPEDEPIIYRIQNETNKNIKSVLKPEQVVEFDKLIEERLNGVDPTKKKKKKKGEEEKVVGIEGLKGGGN